MFEKIIIIVLLIILITTIFGVINPYLTVKNKLRALEIDNNKMDLLMKMDPKIAEEEVDKIIETYLNNYVLDNFIVNNIDYIKKEQIEKMVRDLDKIILISLSELYVFYIKILINIKDDNDLVVYINRKVKEHVLSFVTEFNKPRN